MPKRPMMIDFGETKILERHVAHPMQRGIDIRCASAHFFEKRAKLMFRHPIRW